MSPTDFADSADSGILRCVSKETSYLQSAVGKDMATVLGYKDTRSAVFDHVDKEDKTTEVICLSGSNYKTHAVLINESGLYSLILSSKLPQARKFKHWVTAVVLPQIRGTGTHVPAYILQRAGNIS